MTIKLDLEPRWPPPCYLVDQMQPDAAYDLHLSSTRPDDPNLYFSVVGHPNPWRVPMCGVEWHHEVLWAPPGFELPDDRAVRVPVLTCVDSMYRTLVFDPEWFSTLQVEHSGECLTCDHCMAIAADVYEQR